MTNPAIADNLARIRQQIKAAAEKAKRNADEITLIAVSKGKSAADIAAAIQSGQFEIGENYVQEFLPKYHEINNPNIKWHFIGTLQRNKAKEVIGRIALLHTLDHIRQAHTIENLCATRNRVQDCLIEVKISAEETKHGITSENLETFLSQLKSLEHINVKGLMTIGSLTNDLEQTRREFRLLRELRDDMNRKKVYKHVLTELSMGMSHDFEIAIEEGATLVRIGTLIFGERA